MAAAQRASRLRGRRAARQFHRGGGQAHHRAERGQPPRRGPGKIPRPAAVRAPPPATRADGSRAPPAPRRHPQLRPARRRARRHHRGARRTPPHAARGHAADLRGPARDPHPARFPRRAPVAVDRDRVPLRHRRGGRPVDRLFRAQGHGRHQRPAVDGAPDGAVLAGRAGGRPGRPAGARRPAGPRAPPICRPSSPGRTRCTSASAAGRMGTCGN